MIESVGYDGTYILKDEYNEIKKRNDTVFSGSNMYELTGGRAPHKPGSTGKIWVRVASTHHEAEFYPFVCGLKWVKKNGT